MKAHHETEMESSEDVAVVTGSSNEELSVMESSDQEELSGVNLSEEEDESGVQTSGWRQEARKRVCNLYCSSGRNGNSTLHQ